MVEVARRSQAPPPLGSYEGVAEPAPAPACPPGWRTGPPDFVGVGVQRCGTTRWFDLIVSHPEIQPPPATRKELHFFDRFHAGGFTAADAAAYHEYFPRPEQRKTGEWTAVYLTEVSVPRQLAAAAPDARLLVLLRDPIERYRSALRRQYRVAHALGAPLHAMAPHDAYVRGLYHAQLLRLLAHFDRSQVLILQYEQCVQDPRAVLRRTFEFIGLADTEFTPDLDAHPNRQAGKPELGADVRDALLSAYSPDVRDLVRAFPEIDLGLWPNFAQLDV